MLYKIGEVHFRLLGTNGFHVKGKNERFTTAKTDVLIVSPSRLCRAYAQIISFPNLFMVEFCPFSTCLILISSVSLKSSTDAVPQFRQKLTFHLYE